MLRIPKRPSSAGWAIGRRPGENPHPSFDSVLAAVSLSYERFSAESRGPRGTRQRRSTADHRKKAQTPLDIRIVSPRLGVTEESLKISQSLRICDSSGISDPSDAVAPNSRRTINRALPSEEKKVSHLLTYFSQAVISRAQRDEISAVAVSSCDFSCAR